MAVTENGATGYRSGYRQGVGIALMNRAGLLFVGQRRDASVLAWQMPQGGIDPGESAEEAARRELHEETGVTPDLVRQVAHMDEWLSYDLPADLVGRVWGGHYRGQRQKWFLFRFLGADADINIAMPHPEFSRWCWMGMDDVVQNIVPFKKEVYQKVAAAFRPRLLPDEAR